MVPHDATCPSSASTSIASLVSSGVWSPAAKATQSRQHLGKGTWAVGDEFSVSFICSLSFLDAADRSEIQLYKQRVRQIRALLLPKDPPRPL